MGEGPSRVRIPPSPPSIFITRCFNLTKHSGCASVPHLVPQTNRHRAVDPRQHAPPRIRASHTVPASRSRNRPAPTDPASPPRWQRRSVHGVVAAPSGLSALVTSSCRAPTPSPRRSSATSPHSRPPRRTRTPAGPPGSAPWSHPRLRHPSLSWQKALKHNASTLICYHCHPSGIAGNGANAGVAVAGEPPRPEAIGDQRRAMMTGRSRRFPGGGPNARPAARRARTFGLTGNAPAVIFARSNHASACLPAPCGRCLPWPP